MITTDFRALFTADIGFNIEDWLVAHVKDLRADILKVPHHGSKYASGDAVPPRRGSRGRGDRGRREKYLWPAGRATLGGLASSTHAEVFRTDENGNVEVYEEDGALKIKREK